VQQRVGWTPFVELHHQAKLLARVVADKSREAIAAIFRVFVGVRQVLPAHRFALVSNFRFTVFAEPPQSHCTSAAANTDSPALPLARTHHDRRYRNGERAQTGFATGQNNRYRSMLLRR